MDVKWLLKLLAQTFAFVSANFLFYLK